jgi:hypothetical protein
MTGRALSIRAGLEPATTPFREGRSVQLSYRAKWLAANLHYLICGIFGELWAQFRGAQSRVLRQPWICHAAAHHPNNRWLGFMQFAEVLVEGVMGPNGNRRRFWGYPQGLMTLRGQ